MRLISTNDFQDEGVPWYSDDKWDFVRGQLSSVDRHYGWAHNIGMFSHANFTPLNSLVKCSDVGQAGKRKIKPLGQSGPGR